MKTAGYSGTPLEKKLGIKSGFKIKIVNPPPDYYSFFTNLPPDIEAVNDDLTKKDFIHLFAGNLTELKNNISQLKNELKQNGMLWISWPKKAAKIKTDLDGNIVRETGLENGLVDIKICAVSETWSGLKFVIPLKNRK